MTGMNDPKDDRPYRQPAAPPARRMGVWDETRGLFDQLYAEARRRDAEQRAGTPPRGPVAKALGAAMALAVVFAVGTLVYGISSFRDAPIRETPSGYAGKTGKAYPRDHYERYKLWEKAALASFGATFGIGFLLVVEERARKRRGA